MLAWLWPGFWPGVIVMLELRFGYAMPGLPGLVPDSRKSWIKYGPQRRVSNRELTGMRSPPTACSSMSAISGMAWARRPSSSAAGVNGLPPNEVSATSLCCRETGMDGALYD